MLSGALPPEQGLAVLRWLGLLALAGVLARPLALLLLGGSRAGGGWIRGKLLGWLVAGWVPWLLASLGLPFAQAAPGGLLALAALAFLAWRGRGAGHSPAGLLRGFLLCELAFLALFWLGLALRLGTPDLLSTEKFTDMGLLAAAMRAQAMPPPDPWFAGAAVNYYYLGQAMVAAFGKLAGVRPDHAYQLGMATLFALTGLGSFLLVARLAAPWGRRLAAVLGALAAGLVLYGGNFHSALYTLARPWMPTTKGGFYYPDSTRFIGYDPPAPDKAFTEFPAYGFAVGDLHAHLLATPLVLLALLLILAMLGRGLQGRAPRLRQAAGLGWLLGLALAMNPWDVAILGLLALLAAALIMATPAGPPAARRLHGLGLAAMVTLAVAGLSAAPFLLGFQPFAQGIVAAPAHTPPWQLLVIYGHLLPALLLLAALMRAEGPSPRLLPIVLLALGGLVLVALPEVVAVRDIYGAEYVRTNTMFKLSFRAQPLLMAAALATLAPALARGRLWAGAALLAMVPLLSTLAYLPQIWQPPAVIRDLDGLGFLGDERALVEAAARLPLPPGEAIVEAPGDSFSRAGRVSAMTGLPTVIGWSAHEWLWRSDLAAVQARVTDVDRLLATGSAADACILLTRYRIRYLILGEEERRRYPELGPDGTPALAALTTEVFHDGANAILRLRDGACPG